MALTYKTLSSNFAKVKDKSVAQLGTFIGGKVGENIKSEVFKNGCAIRLSYAFNYSGVPISPSDGQFLLVLIKNGISIVCLI